MYNSKRIGIVILNYNDSDSTINLLNLISDYKVIDCIVVVDNLSTDDSYNKLMVLENEKIKVLLSDKNGGYSYGNNLGAFYLINNYDVDVLFIANPDIEFSESVLIRLTKILITGEAEACSPMMLVPENKEGFVVKKIDSYYRDLLSCTLIIKKLLMRQPEILHINSGRVIVERLPGSFFGMLSVVFKELNGFDDNVFLYCEEKILGKQFQKLNYRMLVDTSQTYLHMESISIDKSIRYIKKMEQTYNSLLYYYDQYTEINIFQMLLLKFFISYGLMVRKFLYPIFSYINK